MPSLEMMKAFRVNSKELDSHVIRSAAMGSALVYCIGRT